MKQQGQGKWAAVPGHPVERGREDPATWAPMAAISGLLLPQQPLLGTDHSL